MKLKIMCLLCLLFIIGCTTLPSNYQNSKTINDSGYYTLQKVVWNVEDETKEGFYLDCVYKEFVFMNVKDYEITTVVDIFKNIAIEEATKRNKTIKL